MVSIYPKASDKDGDLKNILEKVTKIKVQKTNPTSFKEGKKEFSPITLPW
jgi:hypothetical protein